MRIFSHKEMVRGIAFASLGEAIAERDYEFRRWEKKPPIRMYEGEIWGNPIPSWCISTMENYRNMVFIREITADEERTEVQQAERLLESLLCGKWDSSKYSPEGVRELYTISRERLEKALYDVNRLSVRRVNDGTDYAGAGHFLEAAIGYVKDPFRSRDHRRDRNM